MRVASALRRLAGGLVLTLFLSPAWAQTAAPAAAPAALTKAEGLLAPAGAAGDVTLTGTVTLYRNGANPRSGTVTLAAVRGGASRASWAMPAGAITEQWTPAAGASGGGTADTLTGEGANGRVTQPAGASILMPGWAWFAPAQMLARVATGAVSAADLGPEPRNGARVEHLRLWRGREMVDVYVDAATGLPSAMVFRIRPYVAPGRTPPPHIRPHDGLEEVRFSNYQPIGGREVPTHIQASLGSKPVFDITLAGAVFNQGLALGALP